jgi:hypothetical protein
LFTTQSLSAWIPALRVTVTMGKFLQGTLATPLGVLAASRVCRLTLGIILCSTLCRSSSRYCDKLPKRISLKGGKVYFHSGFQSMAFGPCCFGPVAGQYIMAGGDEGGSLSPRDHKKQRGRKGPGPQYPLQGHSPSGLTSFHSYPLLGSTTTK